MYEDILYDEVSDSDWSYELDDQLNQGFVEQEDQLSSWSQNVPRQSQYVDPLENWANPDYGRSAGLMSPQQEQGPLLPIRVDGVIVQQSLSRLNRPLRTTYNRLPGTVAAQPLPVDDVPVRQPLARANRPIRAIYDRLPGTVAAQPLLVDGVPRQSQYVDPLENWANPDYGRSARLMSPQQEQGPLLPIRVDGVPVRQSLSRTNRPIRTTYDRLPGTVAAQPLPFDGVPVRQSLSRANRPIRTTYDRLPGTVTAQPLPVDYGVPVRQSLSRANRPITTTYDRLPGRNSPQRQRQVGRVDDGQSAFVPLQIQIPDAPVQYADDYYDPVYEDDAAQAPELQYSDNTAGYAEVPESAIERPAAFYVPRGIPRGQRNQTMANLRPNQMPPSQLTGYFQSGIPYNPRSPSQPAFAARGDLLAAQSRRVEPQNYPVTPGRPSGVNVRGQGTRRRAGGRGPVPIGDRPRWRY